MRLPVFGSIWSPYRRHLSVGDFNYLLNLTHDLEGRLRMPSEYSNVFLFFRNMAFQQFWLQHELNLADFARQSLLFGRLDPKHPFHEKFAQAHGVSMPQFIELAMMLMTRFMVEKQMSVSADWFKPVSAKYGVGTVQRFFDLLSADLNTLRSFPIKSLEADRKVSYEVYEKTPLRETPLLKSGPNYYPFSPELLARSVESRIYDGLRSANPAEFMNKFGPIFEKYVGASISKMRIPWFSEKDLNQVMPGTGKVVDYLLVDRDAKVFVDAKGVEISYLGMVGHRPEIIKDKTKDSVIKGIQQGFETARRLQPLEKIGEVEIGKTENYLVVVTFKDLFVGNGTDFYQYVAKDTLDRLVAQSGGTRPFPPPFANLRFHPSSALAHCLSVNANNPVVCFC